VEGVREWRRRRGWVEHPGDDDDDCDGEDMDISSEDEDEDEDSDGRVSDVSGSTM